MKALTWKAVFAEMNPSPVFQAVAEFAELRTDQQQRTLLKPMADINAFRVVPGNGERPEGHRNARELIS